MKLSGQSTGPVRHIAVVGEDRMALLAAVALARLPGMAVTLVSTGRPPARTFGEAEGSMAEFPVFLHESLLPDDLQFHKITRRVWMRGSRMQ